MRTPRRLKSGKTERKICTNATPVMPVFTASITAGKLVAHGAVPRRTECCCTKVVCCSTYVMMLPDEQHPYIFQRGSRASGYGAIAAADRVFWSASRVGTRPSLFRAGRRLYLNWTVYQCWCSALTVHTFGVSLYLLVSSACTYSMLVSPKTLKLLGGWFLGSIFFAEGFCFRMAGYER